MPPPSLWSAWLPEHPPLWCPGWVCVLQSRAVQHPGTHTRTGFSWSSSVTLCSLWAAQFYVWQDHDLFKRFWNSGAYNDWVQRTGCMKQAGKQQVVLPLPGSLDVSNSLICLPGRDVDEDRHTSPVSQGPKRILCGSRPETRINLHSSYCLHQQGPTQHGVHGADRPLCPRAL